MSILEDIAINLKAAADVVGDRAEHIVNVSKYKVNLAEIDRSIGKVLLELGKCTYNAKKSGDELAIDAVIAELDELYAQRDAISAEIASWENKRVCPVCGKHCDYKGDYCPACGAKLNTDE